MFRAVSIGSLIGVVVLILVHYSFTGRSRAEGKGPTRRQSNWELLICAGLLISFVVLTLTGFNATILAKDLMTGFPLLLHVAAGGVYMVSLVALAFTWAEANGVRRVETDASNPRSLRFTGLQKFCFWSLLLFGLLSSVTILISMTPTFGDHGQEVLYEAHRASALLAVIFTVFYAYLLLLAKRSP